LKPIEISSSEVFPFFAEAASDSPFYICKDGSLAVFFEMRELYDAELVGDILRILSFGSTFQMYKLKTLQNTRHFGCVKIYMNYSFLERKFLAGLGDSLKRIFSGYDSIVDDINSLTQDFINNMYELLSGRVVFVPVNREISELYKCIADCYTKNGEFHINMLPCADMSVITTAPNRYSVMLSLNSVYETTEFDCADVLKDCEYLQVFSVCAPSKTESDSLDNYFTGTFNLFELLKMEKFNPHELTFSEKEKGFVYTHTSFLLSADSPQNAITLSKRFSDTLEDYGILLFQHTNSAAINYVSLFPGNAQRGYLYQIGYKNSLDSLFQGYFSL